MLTPEQSGALESGLISRHGLLVTVKDGPAWTIVGAGFDIARIFTAVPSGADFLHKYSTALPLIPARGLPSALIALAKDAPTWGHERIETFLHEGVHAEQYREDPAWPVKYLQHREYRAAAEASAYAASAAYRFAVSGVVPSLDSMTHSLVNGYSLGADDLKLVADMLEVALEEVRFGVLRHEATRAVVRELGAFGEVHPLAREAINSGTAGVIS